MTVLLDSWCWIEYFRDGQKAKEMTPYIEDEDEILISTITIAEVHRFLLHHEQKTTADKLTKWMIKRSVTIPVTKEIAIKSAEIKHELKIGLGDALIYATSLSQGVVLVIGDADFKGKDNVKYFGK